MDFKNSTTLDSNLLRETFESSVAGWPTDQLVVRVRWSRGAEFSGTCIYATHRIYINLGRHLQYPYRLETHCARGRKAWGRYYKPSSFLELCDGYQVCLFIFAHEYYHWLVKQAGRNTSQKESMCDRFAARVLIEDYDCVLRDKHGRPLPRDQWYTQDLDAFVAAVVREPTTATPPQLQRAAREVITEKGSNQLLLF
jgi:hypothetical protein